MEHSGTVEGPTGHERHMAESQKVLSYLKRMYCSGGPYQITSPHLSGTRSARSLTISFTCRCGIGKNLLQSFERIVDVSANPVEFPTRRTLIELGKSFVGFLRNQVFHLLLVHADDLRIIPRTAREPIGF